ncbi:FecCD family ABC transporter permease [Gephyromycinifex aptenodytis]|uniref:FecCD family ABC transporter permease n=1 Tax=Gephyromycinifex aptenodytis TaxID=2716227 RepID=UPI001B2FEC36|nr:iron ABC transporter permease [Gephyromycinifex aptenodytis]
MLPESASAAAGRAAAEQVVARRQWLAALTVVVAALVLLAVMWVSSFNGIADVTPARLLAWLGVPTGSEPLSRTEWIVFTEIRGPRVVMGCLAGIALALCGITMQVITGNAMASPFTTGIANAAAFGAATVIVFGWQVAASTELAMVLGAFAWAVLCSVLVFGIARLKSLGSMALVLTGIAMNYLFSAMNAAMQYIAGEQQLAAVVNWTFGNLGQASWLQIGALAGLLCVAVPGALLAARSFTLLSMGEESALASGVRVRRLRGVAGIGVTFLAATVVSFTGVIGFVGLVAPHLAAMIVGHDYRYRLPLAGLLGAILLVVADHVGRVAFSPVTIPVGIVVSFVGVPLFVWLIVRQRPGALA